MKPAHCIPTSARVAAPELSGLDAGWPARGRFGGRWPGELLRRTTDRLWVWLERARQRHQLLQLDEHLRHDLGLTQAAIDAEVAKPFWQP